MTRIRWLGPGVFTDYARDFRAKPDTEHELEDSQAEAYLNHDQFAHKFELVGEPDAETAAALDPDESEDEDESEGVKEPETTENTDDSAYETYPRNELEEMAYSELQELAQDSANSEINGRSSGDDIIDVLTKAEE